MRVLTSIALATTLGMSPLSVHGHSERHGVDPTPELKQRLRALVARQEAYWADHGTYTTDVAALGIFIPHRGPGAPADSIWVQVIQAGGRSWWGRALPRGKPKNSCIIYVGTMADFTAPPTTDAVQLKAQGEGDPICDSF